jgi:hypothetical protein
MTKKRRVAKRAGAKPSRTLAVALSPRKTPRQRVQAMAQAPLAVCESENNLQSVLAILRNTNEPVDVRLGAMDTLATAAFSVVAFEPCRNDYIATLREVVQDANEQIRERALGLLAGEKDGYAQKTLLEGLKKPEKALVPPEKALQLLGYDVHAEAYAVARAMVNNPPNEAAKREALRLLAADAASAPLFEKLLRDKGEQRDIRQIAASALHAIDPENLQKHARELLLDDSDYDDIRATSLTAVEQFGTHESVANDVALLKSVDRMSKAAPAKYKKSARQFLSKYGR